MSLTVTANVTNIDENSATLRAYISEAYDGLTIQWSLSGTSHSGTKTPGGATFGTGPFTLDTVNDLSPDTSYTLTTSLYSGGSLQDTDTETFRTDSAPVSYPDGSVTSALAFPASTDEATINIFWSGASTPNSSIYVVVLDSNDNSVHSDLIDVNSSSGITQTTATGLEESSEYTVQVGLYNPDGSFNDSTEFSFTTASPAVPSISLGNVDTSLTSANVEIVYSDLPEGGGLWVKLVRDKDDSTTYEYSAGLSGSDEITLIFPSLFSYETYNLTVKATSDNVINSTNVLDTVTTSFTTEDVEKFYWSISYESGLAMENYGGDETKVIIASASEWNELLETIYAAYSSFLGQVVTPSESDYASPGETFTAEKYNIIAAQLRSLRGVYDLNDSIPANRTQGEEITAYSLETLETLVNEVIDIIKG